MAQGAAVADDRAGQIAFNNHCRECHSSEKDDNRLGPALYGVVGRKAGTALGYANYSGAMKQSGIVWDEASLDKFIASPDDFLPNNNMQPPYPGLTDAKQRQLIISFLKSDAMMGAAKPAPPAK